MSTVVEKTTLDARRSRNVTALSCSQRVQLLSAAGTSRSRLIRCSTLLGYTCWTPGEAAAFLRHNAEHYADQLTDLFEVMLGTGLRRREILALHWSDVHPWTAALRPLNPHPGQQRAAPSRRALDRGQPHLDQLLPQSHDRLPDGEVRFTGAVVVGSAAMWCSSDRTPGSERTGRLTAFARRLVA